MRQRNVSILFRLNRKEAEKLNKCVKKSGLSREAYLRQLVNGLIPKDEPPPDYYSMMRELHRIEEQLSRISQTAHAQRRIDVQKYDAEVQGFHRIVEQIMEAVVLPERMGTLPKKSAESWLAKQAAPSAKKEEKNWWQ